MKFRFVLGACVAMGVVGCAAPPDTTPDTDPVDADPVAQGPRVLKSVERGPTLDLARDHHVTFALDVQGEHHLYVLGGVTDMTTPQNSYEHSVLDDNGTLSPPQTVSIPISVFSLGAGVATQGGVAVVTGGMRADATGRIANGAAVDVITADDDGTLVFARGPDLPFPSFHGSAAIVNGRVYVVGGQGNASANQSTDRIVSAALDANGALSAWRDEAPLPMTLSHHGLLATTDALLVVGGLTGSPLDGQHESHNEVLQVPVNDDGSLGTATVIGALPFEQTTPALALVDDRLYIIGGLIDDRAVSNDILHAPYSEGVLGAFVSTVTLPQERFHVHQAPVVGDHFYLAGGATLDETFHHESHNTIFVGTFAP